MYYQSAVSCIVVLVDVIFGSWCCSVLFCLVLSVFARSCCDLLFVYFIFIVLVILLLAVFGCIVDYCYLYVYTAVGCIVLLTRHNTTI